MAITINKIHCSKKVKYIFNCGQFKVLVSEATTDFSKITYLATYK